tara:strand:- start:87 stop:461 length:375 start_codon:yes stop_codon:yes gene_type:complete
MANPDETAAIRALALAYKVHSDRRQELLGWLQYVRNTLDETSHVLRNATAIGTSLTLLDPEEQPAPDPGYYADLQAHLEGLVRTLDLMRDAAEKTRYANATLSTGGGTDSLRTALAEALATETD